MKKISESEWRQLLSQDRNQSRLCLRNMDFSGMNLQGMDFSHTDLHGSVFRDADLTGANFRFSNLSGIDISGANLFCANLEGTIQKDIVYDKRTEYYRMYCPEKGAFIGYKKCYNFRIVQLLIPKDAKRTSATNNACRCEKAKVLTIKSIDYQEQFQEASSYVDEKFIYRAGEWAFAKNFNEDRWTDSTTGIHFFMTREEAIGYL